MARGSIERYEGKQGVSYRLRYVVGYDKRGNPIQRRHTVRGNKREAEAKLRELQAQVDQGRYVKPNDITLAVYLERWFGTHEAGLSPTTATRYRTFLDRRLIPALGKVLLQKLTPLQLQEFVDRELREGFHGSRQTRGLSPKTVTDCVLLLKQALKQAETVLNACKGSYAWIPAVIAYHTGARLGEVLALPWDAVNLENGTITIGRGYTLHDDEGPIFRQPKTRAGGARWRSALSW